MLKITLVVPLRLTDNTYEAELRLRRLMNAAPRDLYDILISDYGTEPAHAGALAALEAAGAEVVRHPRPAAIFSIGQARDFGVAMARNPVILFNDIDFYGAEAMYRAIHAEVVRRDMAHNLFDFFSVPVLFLSEQGVERWFSDIADGIPFIKRYSPDWLEENADLIQSTAFGSSAMVVNRHHYLSLGGHAAGFVGHGAEDYDLLHRLSTLAPKGPRPHAYLTDFKDNSVRDYRGFRPLFSLYGLEVFAAGLHLVHLWHPRRREKGYFRPGPNFRLLRRLMQRFEQGGHMPPPLADPHRQGVWLVFYASDHDLQMMRQLLPLSGRYVLRRIKKLPPSARIAAIARAEGADCVLIAPDVRGAASVAADADHLVFQFEHGQGRGNYRLVQLAGQAGPVELGGHAKTITSAKNTRLYSYWTQFEGGPLGDLQSGEIPPPAPLDSPIFESFGGMKSVDRAKSRRARPKKKSSLWLRFKRWLTGY